MAERYDPGLVPGQYNAAFMEQELEKIRMVIDALAQGEEYTAEPNKVYPGLIVQADGTNWDPGSGAGTYIYNSTSGWVKLS